jgi:hypothetical protein
MKQILVLGDSHARIFEEPAFQRLEDCRFEVLAARGASAYGLRNLRSVTQAYTRFKKALDESEASEVIILIGAVDTDFLIWHRAKLGNCGIQRFTEESVSAYCRFLLEVSPQRRVICISAPLPTIADSRKWGGAVNSGRAVAATRLERTNLTLHFNREVQAFCDREGIEYLMLDDQSLGPGGEVRKSLLSSNPADHHYDSRAYAALIAQNLGRIRAFGINFPGAELDETGTLDLRERVIPPAHIPGVRHCAQGQR